MSFRLFKPFYVAFLGVVLLSQNVSIGFCTCLETFFLDNCPAVGAEDDVENSANCDENCLCDEEGENCSVFFNFDLDEFPEIQPCAALPLITFVPLAADLFSFLSDLFPPFSGNTRSQATSRIPNTGVSILLRHSVALI